MSLIFTEGELVFMVGEKVDNWRLDLRGCAVLSRLVHRRPERAVVVPDLTVPPYTHMVMLNQAMFRVRAEELTPEEAEAVGLSRQVTAEEVAEARLGRPLQPVSVAVGLSPGESVQEALDRGLAGWKWHP